MPESLQALVLGCDDGYELLVAPPPISSIETFRSALAACRLPRVIVTALELNLFAVMGPERWSIPKLAQALKVSDRGLEILCRNLAMCRLLSKHGEVYRNTSLAATVLNAKQPQYRGHLSNY